MAGRVSVTSAISKAKRFLDLPFDLLEKQPFIFIAMTYDRRILYINPFAAMKVCEGSILDKSVDEVSLEFPKLNLVPTLSLLNYPLKNHKPISVTTRAGGELIDLNGFPMDDAYAVAIFELVERHSVIEELKDYLKKYRSKRHTEDFAE